MVLGTKFRVVLSTSKVIPRILLVPRHRSYYLTFGRGVRIHQPRISRAAATGQPRPASILWLATVAVNPVRAPPNAAPAPPVFPSAAPLTRPPYAFPLFAEAGTKAKKKAYKRKFWTCRRTKDTDQIQDELKALEVGTRTLSAYLDEDAAGGGAFVCVPCARTFISEAVLQGHLRSKPHKRMAKIVAEPQYTQAEADAGAGRTS